MTAGITILIGNMCKSGDPVAYYLLGAFFIQIISLILGIVSLFGIPRYGARLILWKALIGIIASCGMEFMIILDIIGNAMGHNC